MPAKNLHKSSKELLEIFHDTEGTKAKILEVYPVIEKSMIIHQSIKKILVVYQKLYKKASTIQTTLGKLF